MLVFCFVRYEPAKYGEYVYPVWADLIGWCLALLSVIPMVLTAIIKYARAKGDTWREKWINATRCVVPIEQKQVSTIELESHDKVWTNHWALETIYTLIVITEYIILYYIISSSQTYVFSHKLISQQFYKSLFKLLKSQVNMNCGDDHGPFIKVFINYLTN